MKKGIFFALLFGALFLLLLSLAVFYSQSISSREKALADNGRIGKIAFIADDISSDLLTFLQLDSLSLSRNSSHIFISINETMPLGQSDPQLSLSSYENFIEIEYAGKQNLDGMLQLDLDSFSGSPFIYFSGQNFNYSYLGLSKNSSAFRGTSSVVKYSVLIEPASNDQFSECGWNSQTAGSLAVEIQVSALNCPDQLVYLDPTSENTFFANTTSGIYLNLSFGSVDGLSHSMKVMPNGIPIRSTIEVMALSSQPVIAWLPAKVNFIGEYELSTLIIREN